MLLTLLLVLWLLPIRRFQRWLSSWGLSWEFPGSRHKHKAWLRWAIGGFNVGLPFIPLGNSFSASVSVRYYPKSVRKTKRAGVYVYGGGAIYYEDFITLVGIGAGADIHLTQSGRLYLQPSFGGVLMSLKLCRAVCVTRCDVHLLSGNGQLSIQLCVGCVVGPFEFGQGDF